MLPVTSGFVRQEQIPLAMFLENRFGRAYAGAEAIANNVRFEPWRSPTKTAGNT
jgi:hypothetical protein